MPIHLHRDLESISRKALHVGSLVEEAVGKAIAALLQRDRDLAQEVIDLDPTIDRLEVEVEEEVLKAVALHQPVATDLRYVITVLKLNNDLERIADLAANTAQRAIDLQKEPPLDVAVHHEAMGPLVRQMLRGALDALVERSSTQAWRVVALDDRVDDLHRDNYRVLLEAMRAAPRNVDRAASLLTASRCLERIADLATNVAEDVIFMVEGQVVRHRLGQHEREVREALDAADPAPPDA